MEALFTWLEGRGVSLWATLRSQIGSGARDSLIKGSVEPGVCFLLALLFAVQIGFAVFLLYRFRKGAQGSRGPVPPPRLRLVASRPGALRSRGSSARGRRPRPAGRAIFLARRNHH